MNGGLCVACRQARTSWTACGARTFHVPRYVPRSTFCNGAAASATSTRSHPDPHLTEFGREDGGCTLAEPVTSFGHGLLLCTGNPHTTKSLLGTPGTIAHGEVVHGSSHRKVEAAELVERHREHHEQSPTGRESTRASCSNKRQACVSAPTSCSMHHAAWAAARRTE
jgi:hypothetical protein